MFTKCEAYHPCRTAGQIKTRRSIGTGNWGPITCQCRCCVSRTGHHNTKTHSMGTNLQFFFSNYILERKLTWPWRFNRCWSGWIGVARHKGRVRGRFHIDTRLWYRLWQTSATSWKGRKSVWNLRACVRSTFTSYWHFSSISGLA